MQRQRAASIGFAILAAGFSALPALADGKPPPPPARFAATPKGYGKPLPPPSEGDYPFSRGNLLRCTTSAMEVCVVHSMPRVYQSDPKILPALEAFLTPYAKNGYVSHLDGSARGTIPEYAKGVLKYGCYDASMVAIISAALADRTDDINPVGRTSRFDRPQSYTGLDKTEAQLLWKYEMEFEYEQHVVLGGQRIQAFHFPEVVADVSGGIQQNCDPYTYGACDGLTVTGRSRTASATRQFAPFQSAPSNESVRKSLIAGKLVLIGFERYIPQPTFDAATGTLTVAFILDTLHKVPISGFQQGNFPLMIGDVGDGELHRVSIRTDLSTLTFVPPGDVSPSYIKTIKYVLPDSVGAGPAPFLVYENGEGPYNPEVFFITQYDDLKVPNVAAPK